MDVCLGLDTRADPIETRGKDGVMLELLISFLEDQRHLPMVHLDLAA